MNKKKIAVVVKDLSSGGAERSAAMLSFMLDKLEYNVSFILLYGKIAYNFAGSCYVLNSKGKKRIGIQDRYNFFVDFKRYIEKEDFDFIIDFRGRTSLIREYLICNFVYKKTEDVVFTVHESKLTNYIPRPFFLFKRMYNRALKIVVVSKAIEQQLKIKYPLENVLAINNAIDLKKIQLLKDEKIEEKKEFVLTIGRIDDNIKQFPQLIEIYSQTLLFKRGIKLYIMGDGKLKSDLIKIVNEKKLEDYIRFLPFQKNPYKYMSKAKFLVLCSKREGFPYVLLESLACSTPVISFNCKTGPNEIIQNKFNGLLVDNQNFIELSNAIDRLIQEENLYNTCKKNAKDSVKKFDLHNIKKQWHDLFQQLK